MRLYTLLNKDLQSHTLFNCHPCLDHKRTCTSGTRVNLVCHTFRPDTAKVHSLLKASVPEIQPVQDGGR